VFDFLLRHELVHRHGDVVDDGGRHAHAEDTIEGRHAENVHRLLVTSPNLMLLMLRPAIVTSSLLMKPVQLPVPYCSAELWPFFANMEDLPES